MPRAVVALAQPDFRNWNYDRHVFNQRQQYAYTAGRFRLADPLQLIAGIARDAVPPA